MSQAAKKAAEKAAENAAEEVRCLSVMRSGCDVQCRMMIEGCAFIAFPDRACRAGAL
jgi:hypothetical protein